MSAVEKRYLQRRLLRRLVIPFACADALFLIDFLTSETQGLDNIVLPGMILLMALVWLIPLVYYWRGIVIRIRQGMVEFYPWHFARQPLWREPVANYHHVRCRVKKVTVPASTGVSRQLTDCTVTLWHKNADKRVVILQGHQSEKHARQLTEQAAQLWHLDVQETLYGKRYQRQYEHRNKPLVELVDEGIRKPQRSLDLAVPGMVNVLEQSDQQLLLELKGESRKQALRLSSLFWAAGGLMIGIALFDQSFIAATVITLFTAVAHYSVYRLLSSNEYLSVSADGFAYWHAKDFENPTEEVEWIAIKDIMDIQGPGIRIYSRDRSEFVGILVHSEQTATWVRDQLTLAVSALQCSNNQSKQPPIPRSESIEA